MSKTVDQRVVEMSFDNRNFEKNVKTSLSTIDKLKSSLNFSGMSKGLNELSKSANSVNFNPLTKGIQEVGVQFNALYSIADQTMRRITNSVMDFGLNLGKQLIIDPKKSGFEEYELKMGSIQTIMASTGESLEVVNEYLEKLNEYSDKTIYSFQDMTSNIGKFTNMGVKLEDAVDAIRGVSNEAALSGANANEASRAMYNFAQALSAGYVKLIDWKSIENANMATKDFKDQLIQTAVEMGTLTDIGDGMYKTLEGKTLNAISNFNDSLQDQWMTSDVLIKTLKKYSDETTTLGQRAIAAAQDVKTFSMLIDTLKEAVQSGWAQSFQIIFGDFNQAKKLWTGVSNVLGDIINNTTTLRNQILKEWKEGGGRTDAIETFINLYKSINSLITPIKEAFKEVFSPKISKNLIDITRALKNFTSKLIISGETSNKIKDIFKSFFSVIKIGVNVVETLLIVFYKIVSSLLGFKGSILDVVHNISRFVQNIADAINKSTIFVKTIDLISKAIEKLKKTISIFFAKMKSLLSTSGIEKFIDVLKKFWGFIGIIGGKVVNIASIIANGISKAFSNGSGTLNALVSGSLLSTILLNIKTFGDRFKDSITNLSDAAKTIKDTLVAVKDIFKAYVEEIKAKTLLKIAYAIGILAASLLIISTISMEDLIKSLGTIGLLFGGLIGALKILTKYVSDMKKVDKANKTMIAMSISILILASALKKIASIETEKLLPAVITLSAVMILMVKMANNLGKNGKKIVKGSGQLILMAVAIRVLASSIKTLGKLNLSQLVIGVLGFSSIVISLCAMSQYLNKHQTDMVKAAPGLIAMALSISIMTIAVKSLAKIEPKELAQGLLGFSALMIILAGISEYMSRKKATFAKGSVSMLIMSAALLIIAKVSKIFGEMDWTSLGKAGASIGAILVFAAGLGLIGKMGAGILVASSALLVAGIALTIFSKSIEKLGNMSLKTIGQGLGVMAIAIAALGAAALVLSPVIPAMAALSGVLLLFGASTALIGVGLMSIAAGITALSASLTAGAAGIVAQITIILTGIISLIPNVLKSLADGFVLMITTLAQSLDQIADAIKIILLKIIDVIIACTPKIVEAILTLIDALLQSLDSHMPNIINAGISIVLSLINGIALKQKDIIQSAFNLVISFINGLADAIRDNTDKINDAMANLGSAIIDGLVNFLGIGTAFDKIKEIGKNIISDFIAGINEKKKDLFDSVASLGNNTVKKMKKSLKEKSPSKATYEMGKFFDLGFVNGILDYTRNVYKASNNVGETARNGMSNALSSITDIISEDIGEQPTITPVLDLSNIESGAGRIGTILDSTNVGIGANINAISSGLKIRNQNAVTNGDVVNAIDKLKDSLIEQAPGNTYNLNGISYNDDTPIANAVGDLIKAIEIEGRV